MSPEYELFARVVECGSLSAAGRALNVSPAMVSKRLARLEDRLGAQLVHRTTRRLALTEAGQQFYESVASILVASRDAERQVVGQTHEPTGRLNISAPTSFGRLHIAPHLKGFVDAHPKLQLQMNLSDAYVDLLSERVDVAVRIASEVSSGLSAKLLAPNARILCASPAYIAEHGEPKSLADLSRHRLLAAEGQFPWRLDGRDGPAAVDGESFVKTNSSEVIRELAIAGLGVALRSTWDIAEELRAGKLQRLLMDHAGAANVGIFAVYPKSSLPSRNVESFILYFQALYRTAASWNSVG